MSEVERLAREWHQLAREDLAAAEFVLADASLAPRIAAWHAQQAAEKALKALLVREQIEFPFTHDLLALHDLLPERLTTVDAEDLAELSRFAIEARYPGPWPEPDRADATAAVAAAVSFVSEAGERLER